MTTAERVLIWFLRGTAAMLLAAAPAVLMPTAWMHAIAAAISLDFPDASLLEYLTRTLSALYALAGAGAAFLSSDVRRYLPLLRFAVPATAAFDLTLILVDLAIPMPLPWTLIEAIAIVTWTLALWRLVRRVHQALPRD